MKDYIYAAAMIILICSVALFLKFDRMAKNSDNPQETIAVTESPSPSIEPSPSPSPSPKPSPSPIVIPSIAQPSIAPFNHRHEYGDPFVSCTISERTTGKTKHTFRCVYCGETQEKTNNIVGVCVFGFTLDQHLVWNFEF